ncbi:MAG TPA: trypsin-like peptidase domain-containing protein [Planctomycetota bacterium]|nr:trypsin-like peptidase domain-containing protein [Planctomycetota bacterium]
MTKGWALAALLAAGIAGGVGLAARLDRNGDASSPTLNDALTLQSAFNRAASIATKAVVHITVNGAPGGDNVGSGVIVSSEGHILTNFHVVRETQGKTCLVRFVDGAEFEAEIQGLDWESDLALLKIDRGARTLHPVVFADSDKVRVGDIVFAVGSPFGYTHTVTSGIVSAKHRVVEEDVPYQDYLQTDAAINPGNSGGALVNLRGELVGLNSAMVSGSRTNDGVGLAIASNLVHWVQKRLIRDGVVRRGFLGIVRLDVDIKDLKKGYRVKHPHEESYRIMEPLRNPVLAGAATTEEVVTRLGFKEAAGAFVAAVVSKSPAEEAGLQELDVITELDGRPIRSARELSLRILELDPGTKVAIKFHRGKETQSTSATLGARPPPKSVPVPPARR